VLHKGKPVPAGEVYFDPDVARGHDGPQGFARIKDGRFDTRALGKPLAAGPHIVRVLGFDGNSLPGEELPFGRPLFAEYKQSVDIPAQESVTVDIDASARSRGK
jgi:hypothetical protein